MLLSDVIKDYSRTHLRKTVGTTRPEIESFFAPLVRQAERDLRDEGIARDRIRIDRSLDMRYCGQSYEITVEYGESFEETFHRAHERIYGYREEERETEIVNVRVRGTGSTPTPSFPGRGEVGPDPSRAFEGTRITSYNVCYTKLLRVELYSTTIAGPRRMFPGPRSSLR